MNANAVAHFGGIRYPFRMDKLTLLMSIGADLIHAEMDRVNIALNPLDRVSLSGPIQYAWPHPNTNILYVATSNRSISSLDDCHTLTTVKIDDETGAFQILSEVMLPSRPIHLTVDAQARHVLVVYNAPSLITCHTIDDTGIACPAVFSESPSRLASFPHQVLMLPGTQVAVVVLRGNHPRASHPEEPGALEFFSVGNGPLIHLATVAPGGGFGFGPRHLAFHPNGRWVAVSLERQNALQVFRVDGQCISDEPVACAPTIPDSLISEGINQLAGTLRFHPSGRFLYIVNRHDTAVYEEGRRPSHHDGNNIAVFEFDPESGCATCIQHIATESIHVRTISLDVSGKLLVAASILPTRAVRNNIEEQFPARLSCFRIEDDGRLTLLRLLDQNNLRSSLFWTHLNGCA